jgi:tetratricopeptide (TPR) repeat protein
LLHAILLLQLLAGGPEAQQAEGFVHASIRDYDQGRFEQALQEAEEAYRLYPLAQILFNIGQCQRALEHWDKAAYFYERYLQKLPGAPNRRNVEELEAEVEYRAKLEALRVAPAAPVLRPVPAASPSEASVPPAAVEPWAAAPAAPARSHAASVVLGSVAVASLVVSVIGIAYVESFESLLGQVGSSNPPSYAIWSAEQRQASNEQPHAQAWQWVAGAAGAVALGTATAAVLTW